jgi:hypothetical protein
VHDQYKEEVDNKKTGGMEDVRLTKMAVGGTSGICGKE